MNTPQKTNNQIPLNEKSKMEKFKSLSINSNYKNFIFTIFNNDKYISFNIIDSNIIPKKEYNFLSSFESLKNLNKYFLIFDDIKECVDTIIKNVENKNITFKIEDNICEMIILNLINNKSFSINIPEVEKDINKNLNDMIIITQELNSKILTLENKNNYLEERIKKLEDENIKIQKELSLLIKLNNENTNFLQNLNIIENENLYLFPENENTNFLQNSNIRENENLNLYQNSNIRENENINLFSKSSIIEKEDQNIIINFLEKKPKEFNLLFDTKRDGDNNKTFHGKVNDISPTLIIIKSTNGFKFGGYTTKSWPNNNTYENDKHAFIFSLTKKKKYNIIDENKSAIYGCSNDNSYMFVFGKNHDICIYNNCTQNNKNHVRKSDYNTNEEYELNNGTQYFMVSSLEVYEVKY